MVGAEQELCADSASGEDAGAVPRSWAYRHTPDPEFSRVQTPSLQLPLADPVAFLERHEAVLGHNARNVINIAPEVSSQQVSTDIVQCCRARNFQTEPQGYDGLKTIVSGRLLQPAC